MKTRRKRNRFEGKSCFACGAPATGDEHIPPLCLFPEKKDAKGFRDFRRQLITVPACDAHNLRKSKDDEYLLRVVSRGVFANDIGRTQADTKVRRAHARRPALGIAMMKSARSVELVAAGGADRRAAIEAPVEWARFSRSLELVARGLYFHRLQMRAVGHLHVEADFIAGPPADSGGMRHVWHALCEDMFLGQPEIGSNPDVFWYKLVGDDRRVCWMRFAFYRGCKVSAVFVANSSGDHSRTSLSLREGSSCFLLPEQQWPDSR